MKINNINTVSFKRRLKPNELSEYQATIKEAKKITGQTGNSIFIMPSPNLPQDRAFNSGAGSYSSKYAQEYIDYMRSYIDFNVVEDLPPGQINPHKGFFCSYNSSALALGDQQINPELLLEKRFANLLTKDDLKEIADGNKIVGNEEFVNFKNVAMPEGKQNKVLKKAYDNFLKLDENSELKKKFNAYTKENEFWLNINRSQEPNQGFFNFKQFLADEHLKIGKETLNKKGIKLCGDCPLRFSWDEISAFPNAFKQGETMGVDSWGITALDFDKIFDESSDAYKVFKTKVQLFAKRYDMIRFDVGWEYISPIINKNGKRVNPPNKLGSRLLEQIESWVKEVKGENFDLKNLLYETEASPSDFSPFINDFIIPPLQGRSKIYSSTYMKNKPNDVWGFYSKYLGMGMTEDTLYYGIGNHDPQPLAQIAKGKPDRIRTKNGVEEVSRKEDAIGALSNLFKMSPNELQDPKNFKDAKWADTMSAKNNFMFFMDVFGREERFDKQGFNLIETPHENYAYKVPVDYKAAYHNSLENGLGFNPARALEINLEAKGAYKDNPQLCEKIKKFADILEEKEPLPPKLNKPISGFKKYAAPIIFAGAILTFCGLIFKQNKKNNDLQSENNLQNQQGVSQVQKTPETKVNKAISFDDFQKNTAKI